MFFHRSARICVCLCVSLLAGLPLFFSARAADAGALADTLPHQLGLGLRQMIAWHRSQARGLPASQRRTRLAAQLPGRASRLQANADVTRVVVNIALDGTVPLARVREMLAGLGIDVFAADDEGTGGVLSARLPLDVAESSVSTPGVRSIALVHRPWKSVGKATTQGTFNLGFQGIAPTAGGSGITVGVISDSYDAATVDGSGNPVTDHAAQDIASGDLPGTGNPLGHTAPVVVLADGDLADTTNTDEGRAMLQIVHDLAPSATLAFASSGATPESLAANIRALRTNPSAHCDVIVDDVVFPEEPMFYDGAAAQAVDDVTHSATLPGHKVLYYSAAGNNGDLGYAANFQFVSDADARGVASAGNLRLDQVPAKLTTGGFHNFDTKPGKINLGQKVTVRGSEAELDLQWDDSPPGHAVADSDYNVLVFDAAGNYLPDLSGTDDNTAMGNAVEIVDLPAGDDGGPVVYQLVIARAGNPPVYAGVPPGLTPGYETQRLRYVVHTASGGFTAKFAGHDAPTIFGHAAAPGADAVAAYYTFSPEFPERYSSLGPVTIVFDHDGIPLTTPEVRQQPTLAAVDGVDTTFFPPGPVSATDVDGDGFPNFFGTSAAAPHAAACAALLLEAAGGPGSLTNQQARALLQSTATAPLYADPNLATALAATADGTASVTLQEVRDDIDPANKKTFFRLSFTGDATETLGKVDLVLEEAGMTFDTSNDDTGAPFAVGSTSGVLQKTDVSGSVSSTYAATTDFSQTHLDKLTVKFAPGTFHSGDTVSFGTGIKYLGNSSKLDALELAMIGTVATARISTPGGKVKVRATTSLAAPSGYTPSVGLGLINVGKALGILESDGPPITPDSSTALTPGNVLLTSTGVQTGSSGGRVFEVTPKGQIVQSFALLNTADDANNVHLLQSSALANGKIATVAEGYETAFLIIADPLTGTTKRVTYPGWSNDLGAFNGTPSPAHSITSFGDTVFVYNNSSQDGTLLRYDADADAWQSFGGAIFAGSFAGESYLGVIAGKDGRLYAVSSGPSSRGITSGHNEVFDPATLQVVGSFPESLGYPDLAFDAVGNGYIPQAITSLNSFSDKLLKLGPAGAVLATGDPGDTQAYILAVPRSIQVTKSGALFAAIGNQLLVSDIDFSKFKVVTPLQKGGEFAVAVIDP